MSWPTEAVVVRISAVTAHFGPVLACVASCSPDRFGSIGSETGNACLVGPLNVDRHGANVQPGNLEAKSGTPGRGVAWMRPGTDTAGQRCEPDRKIVRQLPRHTENFRGNTVASRGVRLGAAPDAPLRGRCSSATHCPVGRVVAPRGWPSVHKPEHWTVPATIRARTRRRGWSRPGGSDRANLPDHLAVPGFFCGSCGWGARTCGGRSHSPSRERGATTSR